MSTSFRSGSGPLYVVRMSPKYCPTGDCVGPLKLESAMPRMNSLLRPAPRWVDEKPTDRASIASAPATPSGAKTSPSIFSHCPAKRSDGVSRLLATTMTSSPSFFAGAGSTFGARYGGFRSCCPFRRRRVPGEEHIRVRTHFLQLEAARFRHASKRIGGIHPPPDLGHSAGKQASVGDGDIQLTLTAERSRRLTDSPRRDVDRLGGGMAGSSKGKEREKRRAGNQPPNR